MAKKSKTFGMQVEHGGPDYKGKKTKNGVLDSAKGKKMSKTKDECATPKKKMMKDSVSKIVKPGKKFTPKGKGKTGVAAKGIPKTGPITNKA